MIVDCRTCRNWFDDPESLDSANSRGDRLFYGCSVFGLIEDYRARADCPRYEPVDEPYVRCRTCGLLVPRVCLLLGECVNCTDTDTFCINRCGGGRWRAYCTHWVRLSTEGRVTVQDGELYESFARDEPAPDDAGVRRPGMRELFRRHLKRHGGRPRPRPRRR